MSNLQRLQRVVKSWTGIFREDPPTPLEYSDARAILTELGMQMSPGAYTQIIHSDKLLFEFLQQFYAAEKEMGKSLLTDSKLIDPVFNPKVLEEPGKVTITIQRGEEQEILAELTLE